MVWQVQEAKQRFSEVLRRAKDEGPQTVTRHGDEVAVVVDIKEYRRLKGVGVPPRNFIEFLRNSPDLSELDLTRPEDFGREVDLDD